MKVDVEKPSERSSWQINPSMFEEGPDTWSSSQREGWRLYLVEVLPHKRDVYALTKYSWSNNRTDELMEIGTVTVEPSLSKSDVNEVLSDNEVEEMSEGQYKVLYQAYKDCLVELIQNTTLEKGFEIFDHTIYSESETWNKFLHSKVEDIVNRKKRVLEDLEVGKPHTYPQYLDDSTVEQLASYESLTESQMNNLELIEKAVQRPHSDDVQYAKYCQFVGDLDFESLESYELRAIELVQNGVFRNNAAVAIVQALLEEGLTQAEIADKLGKDESTVSKQVSVAKRLTNRARWHATNVTTDT